MELRHLRYFVAVAEELHFSRAAQRLRISQPPLSVQVRELERELGAELFDRSQRRVALTQAGRVVLERARTILDGVARLQAETRSALSGDTGVRRIAFTQSAGLVAFIPEALRRFRTSFPHVELDLRESPSEEQVRLIGEREIDIGICRRPRRRLSPRIASERLHADPLVLALPADDPLASRSAIALREIADRPIICLPRGEGTGLHDTVIALCQSAGFAPRISRVAGQLLTVVGLVAAGFGVAVVPA